jgi:flagellar hook-basal body complex protein FliE
MTNGILPVASVIAPIAPAVTGVGASTGGEAFQSVLSDAINKVEDFQQNGDGEDLHKVALATQQADLSFQLFLQVRNKIVSAYQEVMRMQV